MVVFAALTGLLYVALQANWADARELSGLQRNIFKQRNLDAANASLSLNVSTCPGYTLTALSESSTGLTASLGLAGPACNAFGVDFQNLTLKVVYETKERIHVSIVDTADSNFVLPESVVARPVADPNTNTNTSDLVFNYDAAPFAFWITRRDDPDGTPLFDTRAASLPATPIPAVVPGDASTALDGFPLVYEDQYLQLTSALPKGANVYGLGEVVASSGIRRDVGESDGNGTIQTMWARDIADPVDQNVYGVHPFYLEHRYDASTKTSKTHGVFLLSAAGSDILLLTPPGSNVSLIEYRQLGGTLDFYFLSGPTSQEVVEQYAQVVGLPMWQNYWAFGFQLCRWGYANVSETKEQVTKMREADIPLEVMWNDIDLYHAVRDFTSDPVSFPGEEMRAFIQELASNHQHYVPIVDAAVAKQVNDTDIYDPYTAGVAKDVFIKNPDGSEYVGQVWPGYTVFPDWFAADAASWWADALRNWSAGGVEFSGLWLDMNEASSFCDGSCGTGADLSNTTAPFILPGEPGNIVTPYPECYNATLFGPSGNMTLNGTLTCDLAQAGAIAKRGVGAGDQTGVDLNTPPYAIHNGNGRLSLHALATNATHAGGLVELDVHNLWGLMEEMATHRALLEIIPGKRPFMISRSTFASAGVWTGHWLGDNFSLWSYMHYAIQGVLQFQFFQIPFVGPDTCGFNQNTDEELCNRWMQLSAFFPFYRNHNEKGALSQEPYRWDSVAEASRSAIATRYTLLPYWYSLFANASMRGTPPVRALFMEFPDEPAVFAIDAQFLIGRSVLVTPVLAPNATSVDGVFPGGGRAVWRDWYTHEVVAAGNATLQAPLGHINVHVRDGAAILLHAEPAYTTNETRAGPYALLVHQAPDGYAMGEAYVDDGDSLPPTPNTTVKFVAKPGSLAIAASGSYAIAQKLTTITILGATNASQVSVAGSAASNFTYDATLEKLVVGGLDIDLNGETTISWS